MQLIRYYLREIEHRFDSNIVNHQSQCSRAHVMEHNEINKWRRWELTVNVLLVAVVLFVLGRAVWA